MNRLVLLVSIVGAAAACTNDKTTPPSPTPPPSWGVPISGGTMAISHDGNHAIVSDPDRDRLVIVDLTKQTSIVTALNAKDEPGRVVEDSAGNFHVALRGGGALVDFTTSGTILGRRAVCAEPRGVAYDPATDVVHVACTSGELYTFPAAAGAATRRLVLPRDLRDVIVTPSGLAVTRFRTAQVLLLDANGNITSTQSPPAVDRSDIDGNTIPGTAAIAWRTIAMPDGTLVMTHQRQVNAPLHETQGGYGGDCNEGPVESAISVLPPGGTMRPATPFAVGALPVDIARSNDGSQLAVVVAGAQSVALTSVTALDGGDEPPCGGGGGGGGGPTGGGGVDGGVGGGGIGGVPTSAGLVINDELGSPTSVAFDPSGNLFIYYPEYPGIVEHPVNGTATTIQLPGGLGYDAGRELFHTQTAISLACASCHPEARDDGLTWLFAGIGQRRTQSVAGFIQERAPYHWSGDLRDLPTLMNTVFTGRMQGPPVDHTQLVSLGPWLERVAPPAPTPVTDAASVTRGEALFNSPVTQCTTCHNGPILSNKALVNVGTGGTFKVPSLLGVGARGPWIHDGCAATLADRFGPCGGGDQHGHTSQLSAQDVTDLVNYLETL